MTISMRFTTPEPSNRFNRSAITGRDEPNAGEPRPPARPPSESSASG